MPNFDKYFTVEEANAALEEVRELLGRIQAIRDHLSVHWEQAQPVLEALPSNGGGSAAHPLLADIKQINARLVRLAEMGVQLKDLDRGLVDFPHWRDGREVFLCWHLGEEKVGFWHELDTGYRGRQPL